MHIYIHSNGQHKGKLNFDHTARAQIKEALAGCGGVCSVISTMGPVEPSTVGATNPPLVTVNGSL